MRLHRWIVPQWIAPFALALGFGALTLAPAPAHASDDLVRVIVDVADVIHRGGHPYYRHGGYGYHDRLVVVRGPYGRHNYYRYVPRHAHYRYGPPHGKAHGHWKKHDRVRCDHRGRCTTRYYDARYDDRRWDNRRWDNGHYRYDDRRWVGYRDDRRWRDDDDD